MISCLDRVTNIFLQYCKYSAAIQNPKSVPKEGKQMFIYKTHGTCSTQIAIETEGDTIVSVKFTNGCRGNTKGIERLVAGMKIDDVIARTEGIPCRNGTSCPDQLAKALKSLKEQSAVQA